MPRTCAITPLFRILTTAQDWLVTRDQAVQAGISLEGIRYRLRTGQWILVLPDIYLAHPGEPSRRQMMIAALLYAGPGSAIDASDACRFRGIKAIAVDDDLIHVVTPFGSRARSRGFVVVRRTKAPIITVSTNFLTYVDPALIESSAVIHETNGRSAHAREDLFEDMQERPDVLTTTGFIVLHNPPRRVHRRGREVIAQVERCHELYDGRGMPAGVTRLAIAA